MVDPELLEAVVHAQAAGKGHCAEEREHVDRDACLLAWGRAASGSEPWAVGYELFPVVATRTTEGGQWALGSTERWHTNSRLRKGPNSAKPPWDAFLGVLDAKRRATSCCAGAARTARRPAREIIAVLVISGEGRGR